MAVNVCCLKWGTKYNSAYVNKLAAMVRRNLSKPHRFICFTDDTTGIHPSIECKPLLDNELNSWWHKLSFFRPKIYDLEGTLFFLDLDIVIVGELDSFFDYPGDLCMIKDWLAPSFPFFNSSVFRLKIGSKPDVYNNFLKENPQNIMSTYAGDQNWISKQNPNTTVWPALWCVSFKWQCIPLRPSCPIIPQGAKIIVFHGKPNPDDAIQNHYIISGPQHLLPQGNIRVGPAPWIRDFWNTDGLA